MLNLPNINECLRDHLRPAVQKGAALLDEKVPGWVDKINTTKLSIASGEVCICGQVFGDYSMRTVGVDNPYECGFSVSDDMIPDSFRQYCTCCKAPQPYVPSEVTAHMWRTLDTLWLDEIYWRTGP